MDGHRKQKEQSRQMIESALFDLLEEQDYAQITVTEIVRRADVSRRTFYRLYDSKESVLHGYFRQLCREYRDGYPALNGYDFRQIAEDYFSFWHQKREILLKLHRAGLDDVLHAEINHASAEVIGMRIGDERLRQRPGLQYFADYSAGGFASLLFRWIDSGMEETPVQYADKISKGILMVVSR